MITSEKFPMYTAVCDSCNETYGDDEHTYWETSQSIVRERAQESGWTIDEHGMCLCPNCQMNNETESTD